MNQQAASANYGPQSNIQSNTGVTLVLGGTGKTGRRVAERLQALGREVCIASRSGNPGFDWNDESTWRAALADVTAVYIAFAPDLAVPGADRIIAAFTNLAVESGVQRLVLLSGRGEEQAQSCERIVQAAGVPWTIVRAGWFSQNFSEGAFLGMVKQGVINLPAGEVPEPFVDVEDIADVAAAALVEGGHEYEVYEVTGPRLMTFMDVAGEIARATGREIRFVPVPQATFDRTVRGSGAPEEYVWLLNYLFGTVLDGRNAYLADGVQRALGRLPRDFSDFARRTAATGAWHAGDGEKAV